METNVKRSTGIKSKRVKENTGQPIENIFPLISQQFEQFLLVLYFLINL